MFHPWNSVYAFAEGSPIVNIDLDGLEKYYTGSGELIGKYGTSNKIRIVYWEDVKMAKQEFQKYNANKEAYQKSKSGGYLAHYLERVGSTKLFNNSDEAAINWGSRYNSESIKLNREMSTIIYEISIEGNTCIFYTKTHISPNISSTFYDKSSLPNHAVIRAYMHSHGSYMEQFGNDKFSPADIKNANDRFNTNLIEYSYIVTPIGELKRYDSGLKKQTIIDDNMPFDKYHPEKVSFLDIFDINFQIERNKETQKRNKDYGFEKKKK